MSKTVRHTIHLNDVLSRQLAALAAGPGGSKSAVVGEALQAWLSREAGIGIDPLIKARLDRTSRSLHRLERNLHILIETLALFIRYQLSVTPPVAEAEQPAASALGQRRFQSFIDQVGRRLAAGRRLSDDLVRYLPPEAFVVAAEPEGASETAPGQDEPEQDATGQEVSGSGISGPEISGPGLSGPESSVPEISDPEISGQDVRNPEVPGQIISEQVELPSAPAGGGGASLPGIAAMEQAAEQQASKRPAEAAGNGVAEAAS
jgi:hypothetical protein